MEKMRQRELAQQQRQRNLKEQAYKDALSNILSSDETLNIKLAYCIKSLPHTTALGDYSPTYISRLVFQKQLCQIKEQFSKLPNKQCRVQHFLAIMLKVMQFPFDKIPCFMVGLKDMFQEVADGNAFTYDILFKYILGELVTINDEEQNTSFQVRYAEKKKQDYLLHDNGIKKIHLSRDLKMFMALDERGYMLKLYDLQMKSLGKFTPKRQKHCNKFPMILGFDYSDITQKLGLILSDETLSVVHLGNYLTKSAAQFDNWALNEVVLSTDKGMRLIYYMQMQNKWLTVEQEKNNMYLFDMDRARQQPDKVMSMIRLPDDTLDISQVLQIIPLSVVCVVAANTITFFNENLSECKYRTFSHHQTITVFKYCEEKNQFYLSGKEKMITVFSISRNGHFKIWTLSVARTIIDFEVFPFLDTIVVADDTHQVRLVHEPTRTVYQQQSYAHIVKNKDTNLHTYKISKTEMIVYQTYMLILEQEKIAIEKDVEYSFLPYCYWHKGEIYVSLNSQILSFSLLHGEIRKHFTVDQHLQAFVAAPSLFVAAPSLFVVDHQASLYELFTKDSPVPAENKMCRKKVAFDHIVNVHYDCEAAVLILVTTNALQQLKNCTNNTFNSINSLNLKDYPPIHHTIYSPNRKILTLISTQQRVFQFKIYDKQITNGIQFVFSADPTDHQDRVIVDLFYDECYDIFIILTNKNELYFANKKQQSCISLKQYLPYKLRDLSFSRFRYQLLGKEIYLIVMDDKGFVLELKPTLQIVKVFGQPSLMKQQYHQCYKETTTTLFQGVRMEKIWLGQPAKDTQLIQNKDKYLWKAHEKRVILTMKLRMEILTTLTIAVDGYVRLWNEQRVCLCSLKLPTLTKIVWNMKQIQEIKNRKSIKELGQIFSSKFQIAKMSPAQLTSKIKKIKKPQQLKNTALQFQFQSKELEELVLREHDYTLEKIAVQSTRSTPKSKIYHPWRTRKEFRKLFDKASPPHRLPLDLLELRTSLDMADKTVKPMEMTQRLPILPQLSLYQPEPRTLATPVENQEEDIQKFQSCVYVKSDRKKRKINELDQIDKEFKKKDMTMTSRRFVPRKNKHKKQKSSEKNQIIHAFIETDPIKAIFRIFQEHNKECLETKKGNLIKIPKISILQ